MYLYYDSNGILKEIVDDTKSRRGNGEVNKLYIYTEDITPKSVWITYKTSDGETTTETLIETRQTKCIPYSRTRDLKYFTDLKDYQFFVATIPSDVLAVSGLTQASIRLALQNNAFLTLGTIVFTIEESVLIQESTIRESEYQYLLSLFSNVDELLRTGVIGTSEQIIESASSPYDLGRIVVSSYNDEITIAKVVENSEGYNVYQIIGTTLTQAIDYDAENEVLNGLQINDRSYKIVPHGDTNDTESNVAIGVGSKSYGENNIAIGHNTINNDQENATFTFDTPEINRTLILYDLDKIALRNENVSDYDGVYEYTNKQTLKAYLESNYYYNTAIDEKIDTINTSIDTTNSNLESVKSDLANNYYTKTENDSAFNSVYVEINAVKTNLDENYYTITKINELVSSLSHLEFEIVSALPEVGDRQKIYLLALTSTNENNIYEEYVWIESTQSYERLGTTDIDLSPYYTQVEIDTILLDYAKSSDLDNYVLLSVYNTKISSIDSSISNFESRINAIESDYVVSSTLNNYYDIDTIDGKIGELNTSIATLSENLTNNYYTITQLDNAFNYYYTKTEVDTIIAAATGVDLNDYYKKDEIESLFDDFEDNIDDLIYRYLINNNYDTGDYLKDLMTKTNGVLPNSSTYGNSFTFVAGTAIQSFFTMTLDEYNKTTGMWVMPTYNSQSYFGRASTFVRFPHTKNTSFTHNQTFVLFDVITNYIERIFNLIITRSGDNMVATISYVGYKQTSSGTSATTAVYLNVNNSYNYTCTIYYDFETRENFEE